MSNESLLIITGASRGIGLATARLFLSQGYKVINLSRSPVPVSDIGHIPVDFERENWWESLDGSLINAVRSARRVCIVHSAGRIDKGGAADFAVDDFSASMRVNVLAPALLNRQLLPLLTTGSSVIFVGSTLSEKAVANSTAYVTAKHAVVGLMRSTCQDLLGKDIHTACVCPGFTKTEMLKEHLGVDDAGLDSMADQLCQTRLIEPAEIAGLIWYCAQNPVVNGSVIHANLGQVER